MPPNANPVDDRPYPETSESVAELRVFRTTAPKWTSLIAWRGEMRRKGWTLLGVGTERGESIAVFGADPGGAQAASRHHGMTVALMRRLALAASALGFSCAGHGGGPAAAGPAALAARPVRLAPGITRYRTASHTHAEQQVGGQTQSIEEALIYYVTARIEPQGTGLRAAFTVDSIERYDTGGQMGVGTERARGATLVGTLSPSGEISDLSRGDSTARLLKRLGEELAHFYPKMPREGLEPGARWSDTTETQSGASGLPLTVHAVNEHEVGAPLDTGSARALPITTLTSYTFAGAGSQGGQAYSVRGEGRRHAIELVALGGQYAGMTAADTSAFTISMRAVDVSIPGRQTRADTLSVIP